MKKYIAKANQFWKEGTECKFIAEHGDKTHRLFEFEGTYTLRCKQDVAVFDKEYPNCKIGDDVITRDLELFDDLEDVFEIIED